MLCVKCYVSSVMCQVFCVTRHVRRCVTHHVSGTVSHMCQVSCVTHHVSGILSHPSYVRCCDYLKTSETILKFSYEKSLTDGALY